jgi:hypothetical protein
MVRQQHTRWMLAAAAAVALLLACAVPACHAARLDVDAGKVVQRVRVVWSRDGWVWWCAAATRAVHC